MWFIKSEKRCNYPLSIIKAILLPQHKAIAPPKATELEERRFFYRGKER
ncbi:hypothetical protein [Okeania sp.]|nr:hypothetical protein [Okeania sp.]MEB3339343.1 hypothetical protein [Okeania sp.]